MQYGETDYDFLARMAAEEGLFFYEEHSSDSDDQSLVLCDTVRFLPKAFENPVEPEYPYRSEHAVHQPVPS